MLLEKQLKLVFLAIFNKEQRIGKSLGWIIQFQ